MSVSCGVECALVFGCSRWALKRCTRVGSDDSETWPLATHDEFHPVPRLCRLILAVYEPDLRNPQCPPDGGYRLNPDWVLKHADYEQTLGRSPPYLIYADHDRKEIVVAIRGLNLVKDSDYKLLLDNRLGMQMFDGGYVHHGLLKSAVWLLNEESQTLKRVWEDTGREYQLILAGHSLGSGVAALMTVVLVNHRDRLGGIPRNKIRCYALAPARCMSLNLAVKYADVIHSIVLQDDFLPRTATPLEDIFKSIFCLPCLIFLVCLRDTFIPEGRKLKDPRRLYAPGRMYHIVERKFCRCGRFPPEVRTAIPVDERFERIVLSCNATADHGIIWIERESEKALEVMRENKSETITVPPKIQKLERLKTLEKEHEDALQKAVSLNIPYAVPIAGETIEIGIEEMETETEAVEANNGDNPKAKPELSSRGTNWDELVEKLFERSESGKLILNRELTTRQIQ
ncbi:endo-1,4-beta-xylanase Z-like [Hibiscus syriacus]|uniref:Endo-1,4-beta-xylanase Z-like n=1 Tax=Hibiscus syriacus TaxID=106335 RepID=A0A6A2Z4A3_HIBSY|nr:diacylglycerol lipase-alpha-like [Hibiscus syriacus]KAE8685935.1 endo-1,4-beta-xylanase Z-like [Hibiscus syriacus]